MRDALLFDLGGIFVFHDDALRLRRLAEAFGTSPQALVPVLNELEEAFEKGRLEGEALHQALERRFGPLDYPRFVELWSSHFTRNEEALALAAWLKDRTRLVLVSNTNRLHFDFLRPRLPELENFDAWVLSYELGHRKPAPEIFRAALRLSGARPGKALYFDDRTEHVEGARRVGLDAELFTDARKARALIEEE